MILTQSGAGLLFPWILTGEGQVLMNEDKYKPEWVHFRFPIADCRLVVVSSECSVHRSDRSYRSYITDEPLITHQSPIGNRKSAIWWPSSVQLCALCL